MRRAIPSHASPIDSVLMVISWSTRSTSPAYVVLFQQSVLQRIESDAAEVKSLLVEVLGAKRRALARLVLVPNLLPDALADLVRGSLSWPAEVVVHLEAHELGRHVDVPAHEVEGVIAGPWPLAVRT